MPVSDPPNLATSMQSLDITAPSKGGASARGRDEDYQYASDTGPVGGESGGLVQSNRVDTQNPYLDLSNLTLPDNPAEAYQLCRMLIQTFPIHQAYVHKMSTMAVTDPDITPADEPSDALEAIVSNEKGAIDPYINFLRNKIGLKDVGLQAAYNNFGFSVAVILLSLPFDKWFTCRNCDHEFRLSEEVDYRVGVGSPDFEAKCPNCGHHGRGRTVDKPNREDINRTSLVALAAENVQITRNPLTGRRKVYYRIPQTDLDDFRENRVPRDEYLDYSQEYLRAIHNSRIGIDASADVWVKLNQEYVYVITAPSYYLDRQGLPFPRLAATFKDTWLVRKLQKSQESIADAHLVPLEILFPDSGTLRTGDMFAYADMPSYMAKLTDAISQHGRDKNMKAVMPFPVGHHKIGGDGKAMLLAGELRVLYEVISAGMNCPIELVFGGLCLTGDALVQTDQGLVRIRDMVGPRKANDARGTFVYTHEGERTEVLLTHRLGSKEKWELRLESGRLLYGASTHPVLTDRGFVPYEELLPSDRVAVRANTFVSPDRPYDESKVDLAIGSTTRCSALPDVVFRLREDELRKFLRVEADDVGCDIASYLGCKEYVSDLQTLWTALGKSSRVLTRPDDTYCLRVNLKGDIGGILYDSISSCSRTGEMVEMYDLTVDHDVHSYVANGIAVHNSFSGSSISVKLLKLDLDFIREHIERMWQWAADLISAHMRRPRVNVRITDLHLGDDLARLQFQASLVDSDKLSLAHFHEEYGVDHENEIARIKSTQRLRAEIDKIRFTAQSEAQNEGFQQQTIQQQVAPLRAMLEQLAELKDVREILASDPELEQLAKSSPEFAPLIPSAAILTDGGEEIQQPLQVEPVDYALADQMADASQDFSDTFDPHETAALIAEQVANIDPQYWQQAISETEDQYGTEVVQELTRILNEGQAMANSARPTERPGVRGPMMSS